MIPKVQKQILIWTEAAREFKMYRMNDVSFSRSKKRFWIRIIQTVVFRIFEFLEKEFDECERNRRKNPEDLLERNEMKWENYQELRITDSDLFVSALK